MSESFAKGYVDMMRAKDEGIGNGACARRRAVADELCQWCGQELKPAVLA